MAQTTTSNPRPCGRGIVVDDNGKRVVLVEGVTFVDAANAADPAQDGTAEHPFAAIGQAVEQAGEGGVIFVNGGEYDEAVALEPGQTLTSELDLPDGFGIARHASAEAPLIRPGEDTLVHEDGGQAAVRLREGNVLRRVRVAIPAGVGDSVYARVSGEHGDAGLVIAQCLLPDGGVEIRLEGGALGNLELIDNGSPERGEGRPDEESEESGVIRLGPARIRGKEDFRLGRLILARNKVDWGELLIDLSGTLGALEMSDNVIAGADGTGTYLEMSIRGDASVIRLDNNRVAYNGSKGRNGLSLEFDGCKVERAVLENNDFLGGDEASGVDISLRGARLGELRLEANSIETNTYFPENDVAVLNMYIDEDTRLGSCLVVDNSVTLHADYGDEDAEDQDDQDVDDNDEEGDEDADVERGERVAVRVEQAPGAHVDGLEIRDNDISLPDDDCVDVRVIRE